MRTKAAFLIGAAVGYVLGTRAGREQFEKIRAGAQQVWEDPRVQEKVADASGFVKEKAPDLKDKVEGAVKQATDAVKSRTGSSDEPTTWSTGSSTGTGSTGTGPTGTGSNGSPSI